MSSDDTPSIRPQPVEPDVKLELESEGTRRIWAIYSEDQAPPRSVPLSAPPAEGGLDLAELFGLLRRGRWHIALWVGLLLALGVGYLQIAEPIYNAVARVLVAPRATLSDQFRREAGGSQFISTQAEIISSPVVIEDAISNLDFPVVDKPEADPVRAVSEALTATPIQGTNVLSLAYVAPSPTHAVRVLEEVIASYRTFVRRIEEEDHSQDFAVLARREQELRDRLEVLNAEFNERHSASDVIGEASNSVNVQRDLLQRLTDQLVEAQAYRIGLETELAALDRFGFAGAGRGEFDSRQLRSDLWRSEAVVAELEARYSAKHPEVLKAQQQSRALQTQLEKAIELERKSLERELAAARSTEERLQEIYASQVTAAKAVDAQRIQVKQLEAEIAEVAAVHRSTLTMLRDAELTGRGLEEGRAKIAIHVVNAPMPPKKPMWPSPVLVLAPCVLIGVLLGMGTAWLTGAGLETAESAPKRAARPGVETARVDAPLSLGQPEKSESV